MGLRVVDVVGLEVHDAPLRAQALQRRRDLPAGLDLVQVGHERQLVDDLDVGCAGHALAVALIGAVGEAHEDPAGLPARALARVAVVERGRGDRRGEEHYGERERDRRDQVPKSHVHSPAQRPALLRRVVAGRHHDGLARRARGPAREQRRRGADWDLVDLDGDPTFARTTSGCNGMRPKAAVATLSVPKATAYGAAAARDSLATLVARRVGDGQANALAWQDQLLRGSDVEPRAGSRPQAWVFPTDAFAPAKTLELGVALDDPWYRGLITDPIKVRVDAVCQ